MRLIGGLYVAAALALAGCAGEIVSAPEVALPSRADVPTEPVLALAVVDQEAATRGGDFATRLAEAIRSAYGGAIEIVANARLPVPQRVSVRLRVKMVGAIYNRRRADRAAVVAGETADWSEVADIAANPPYKVPPPGTSYERPGLWSGIADLMIEVYDRRAGHDTAFMVPVTAERTVREQGGGAVTARVAAAAAWEQVNVRLARFLDAAVGKVAAEQR
jgi:hypothetical protein